ncbi:MAG: DUF2889 domain-containing protein [Proteobacteria bacterium]|nr:DUF2889 domain-containing protein [Pseudomonadota bacterium]
MGLLEKKKSDRIHTRAISLATYEAENNCVIVEGILRDNRLIDVYLLTGEPRQPGVIHHMVVRILVGPPGLTIQDIEVEMPVTPREHCVETIRGYDRMKGIAIQTGFTAKVKEMMGGRNGCAHLTTLLIAMGPEAVQGYYAHYAKNPPDTIDNKLKFVLANHLKNTCHVWREDGPYYQTMVEAINP